MPERSPDFATESRGKDQRMRIPFHVRIYSPQRRNVIEGV